MRRRLYLQVYVTVVASLVLFALIAGFFWRQLADASPARQAFEILSELAQAAIPEAGAPREAQQAALEGLRKRVRGDLALYSGDGTLLAAIGAALPSPEPGRTASGWIRGANGRHAWAISLPDGRWLVARIPRNRRPNPMVALFVALGLIVLGVAVGAYPVVRRLTRRLERLQAGVDALGAGNLAARVTVEGRDEVSSLAQSFNRAAERIEELVGAHKTLLANASHELRSPLARIRMGIEMLNTQAKPELRIELERDIAELDAQIDEILLASRLEATPDMEPKLPVDLLALAAEECARADAVLEGESVTLGGDERLLRRMLRNLLDNGRRYGAGSKVEVTLRVNRAMGARSTVQLDVCDRGPGVPETERERIFEPFYRPAGAREREGSVGLGLSLARSIARRHGGDVRCLAREGGGSCFRVELPV